MRTEHWPSLVDKRSRRRAGLLGSTTIPDLFVTDVPGRTAKEKLEIEIYQHSGIRGDSEQLLYLAGVMIGAFGCPWTSFVVMPEAP